MGRNELLVLFGDVIRHRRYDLGLTQAGVALAVGVTSSTICYWEGGHLTRLPRPGDFRRLCSVLEFDPATLLQETEYALPVFATRTRRRNPHVLDPNPHDSVRHSAM